MMFFLALPGDGERFAKGETHGAIGMDGAEVLETGSIGPGVGFQGQGHYGNAGPLRQLDADGVEMRRVKDRRAGALRKNDDRCAGGQLLASLAENDGEILARVGPPHHNGVASEELPQTGGT